MGLMSNFKMPNIDIPKIDSSILPSSSDFGINTGEINGMVSDVVNKVDLKNKIDLSKYPNLKDTAMDVVKNVPAIGSFSLVSLIPSSFFDEIDTTKIQSDINNKLGEINLGELGTLKLPDDVGSMAKDIISGKGVDFMSLYSMPAMETPTYNIDSTFDLDEITSEMNQISSIASDEFNMNEYMNKANVIIAKPNYLFYIQF